MHTCTYTYFQLGSIHYTGYVSFTCFHFIPRYRFTLSFFLSLSLFLSISRLFGLLGCNQFPLFIMFSAANLVAVDIAKAVSGRTFFFILSLFRIFPFVPPNLFILPLDYFFISYSVHIL